VQLYIDGFNDNDISKFKEAFHEDAWIFFIDAEGHLHKNLISESFEEWAAPPSSVIVGRFISVTQVGDAASGYLSFNGRVQRMARLPQSAEDQRCLEDYEQDRHPQQPVKWAHGLLAKSPEPIRSASHDLCRAAARRAAGFPLPPRKRGKPVIEAGRPSCR
jgi:hypothetical protein